VDRFGLKYPLQAEVVKLCYFTGMTNEEVSQLLGISINSSIANRRCRLALRAQVVS
jgi:DNA-directed RNA polymerase specialized sigma24 family protein